MQIGEKRICKFCHKEIVYEYHGWYRQSTNVYGWYSYCFDKDKFHEPETNLDYLERKYNESR